MLAEGEIDTGVGLLGTINVEVEMARWGDRVFVIKVAAGEGSGMVIG